MVYELSRLGETHPLVSWDGSGDFDGEYDDGRADLQTSPAVRIDRGRDGERAFGRPKAALATWRYRNQDRLYSAQNTASPLRGLLLPGRPCQIYKTIGDELATMDSTVVTMDDPEALMGGLDEVPLFTGVTDVPRELYGPGPRRRWLDMQAIGNLTRLQGVEITIALQTNITSGALMVLVFEAAGLTSAEYVVDASAISNGRIFAFYWVDGRDAFEVAIEVWRSEGPTAYLGEDGRGRIVFEGAEYRALTARSQTVQQTFTVTDVTRDSALMDSPDVAMDDSRVAMDGTSASVSFVGLEYLSGLKQIVNDVGFEIDQRAAQSTQQVWEYSGAITLAASESRTIIARVNDPLVAITTPALTTDYTIGAGSLTSVTATQLGPLAVSITLVAGGSGATVNPPAGGVGLRLRAQPLTLVATLVARPTVDTSASQALYGVRSLPADVKPWRGLRYDDGVGVADAWALAYRDDRPAVLLTIVNTSGRLLREELTRDVSDLIHVVDANESGLDLDLSIESIVHEIAGDWFHKVTFRCEKRIEQDWGLWDVARWDVDLWGQ